MSIKSVLNLSGTKSKWVCPSHACTMLCGETEASYQGHHCYLHLRSGHCHFGTEMVNWRLWHSTISQYTHFKLSLDSSHLCIVWLLVDTRTIITMYVLWLHVQKSSLSELTKFGYKNKSWHRTVGRVVTRHCHNIKRYMRSLEKKIEANPSRTRSKWLVCTKQWGCTTGRSGPELNLLRTPELLFPTSGILGPAIPGLEILASDLRLCRTYVRDWIKPQRLCEYSVLHFTLESHDARNSWFFVWRNQIRDNQVTIVLLYFSRGHQTPISGFVSVLLHLSTPLVVVSPTIS